VHCLGKVGRSPSLLEIAWQHPGGPGNGVGYQQRLMRPRSLHQRPFAQSAWNGACRLVDTSGGVWPRPVLLMVGAEDRVGGGDPAPLEVQTHCEDEGVK
jgi:hypothetical protein